MNEDDATAGELVTYAARLIRLVRRRQQAGAGIRVLSILDEVDGSAGVTRLAELDHCSQPTMSATVSSLVDQGLVLKQPNPDDARASLVVLTDAGRAALTEFRAASARTVSALIAESDLPRADVAKAVDVLRALIQAEKGHS